jgi:hypothetical protein
MAFSRRRMRFATSILSLTVGEDRPDRAAAPGVDRGLGGEVLGGSQSRPDCGPSPRRPGAASGDTPTRRCRRETRGRGHGPRQLGGRQMLTRCAKSAEWERAIASARHLGIGDGCHVSQRRNGGRVLGAHSLPTRDPSRTLVASAHGPTGAYL